MLPSSTQALFDQCLVGNYDDDLPWNAVFELRKIGTLEIFDKATAWCESPQPLCRARGLDILAQIGCTMETHENSFPDESFGVVCKLLDVETDEQPLPSAIYALGHIRNSSSVPLIVKWVAHPEGSVRFAVAFALGSFPDDLISIQALIALMRDVDEDVRNWATFGLGVQGETDTQEIREELLERVADPFKDVRMEAFIGLGKRKDPRIIPKLLSILSEDEVAEGYLEAAELLLGVDNESCQDWKFSDYSEKIRKLII